jgi:glucose/arabinose dehydrogenase
MLKTISTLVLSSGLLLACFSKINPPSKIFTTNYSGNLPIDTLSLPDGFKVSVYAEGVTNARSMTLGDDGTLYVSTRNEGNVYALKDTDGDFKVDQTVTLLSGLTLPNGVAFRNGDLYIAEVSRILKIEDVANKIKEDAEFVVINDDYPEKKHHGWKYIAFGPDDKLYVPVGAPCNICESEDEIFNTITRMDPDGSNKEIVHRGIRNSVGFDWHPETKELFFTDNGRDWMGDDSPSCELNHAPKDGMHFGYPYCHEGSTLDPKLGEEKTCDDYTPPAQKLGAHVAPLGIEFYEGDMFPAEYKNQAFVALHGSWNREKKSGYEIVLVSFENNKAVKTTTFISGWLNNETDNVWGRPVDLEELPDGSLLISDDYADAIYRVYYEG